MQNIKVAIQPFNAVFSVAIAESTPTCVSRAFNLSVFVSVYVSVCMCLCVCACVTERHREELYVSRGRNYGMYLRLGMRYESEI